jgi:hypothetical protein
VVAARRAAVAWLYTALVACDVTLATPDDVRVRCVDDADCPSERCSTIGVCIARDDDDSPLRVASVDAVDSRHIVVVFSRPVDPESASDHTVYALSPALTPEQAEVAPDRLSVAVRTSEQKLRPYLLDVRDVVDPIGRPLERTQMEITGAGELVSAQAPTPLTPADHALLGEGPVRLSWSRLPDALNYTVEVIRHTRSGMSAIDGSPFVGRETELTPSLAADA